MLVNSSRSSTDSSVSSTHSSNNIVMDTSYHIPSTIVWTQTLETITLHIRINHVRVLLSEKCLKLSNRSRTISLPLFDKVYIDQCDIDQMTITNNSLNTTENILILTFEKECCEYWPHLLMQQTDDEIQAHLIEANFLVHIQQQEPTNVNTTLALYDTLDFETVINGQGEKTGLE